MNRGERTVTSLRTTPLVTLVVAFLVVFGFGKLIGPDRIEPPPPGPVTSVVTPPSSGPIPATTTPPPPHHGKRHFAGKVVADTRRPARCGRRVHGQLADLQTPNPETKPRSSGSLVSCASGSDAWATDERLTA